MSAELQTIPSHTYEPTKDKNIFRFVDRDGNWTHYWIKSRKIFVPAVNHIIRNGYPKGERFYMYLLNAHPEEAARRLATAAEEGARTHDALRDLIGGGTVTITSTYYNEITKSFEPPSIEEWKNLRAFAEWCKTYKPQKLVFEHAVWSEQFLYAGTIDFVGTIKIPPDDKTVPEHVRGKRILILIDWKTSSGIWDEYELQTAAYRTALLERQAGQVPLSRFGGLWTGVVRLGTGHKLGYEMKIWDPDQSEVNFNLFCAAYNIYRRKSGDTFEPEIEHMPTAISLSIPEVAVKKRRTRKKRKNPQAGSSGE